MPDFSLAHLTVLNLPPPEMISLVGADRLSSPWACASSP